MEKTTNYDQFKHLEYNRKVNEGHVLYMMKIIRIKNRLEYFPIIVDADFGIIDGQHRLEAAKRLGLPIYYEIKKNAEPQDVYTINIAQKKWSRDDVLNYYQAQGEGSYQLLNEFMRKNKLNLNNAIVFVEDSGIGGRSNFKEGKLEITHANIEEAQEKFDKYERFITYVDQKTIGKKIYLNSPILKKAFVAFCNMKGFDFDLFMHKLPYGLQYMRPTGIKDEYLKMLLSIYHWKNISKRLDGGEAVNE